MRIEQIARWTAPWRGEKPLFWTGVAGLALGTFCLAAMIVHGPVVEPEGRLFKAASFDLAVGIFVLTLALVLPLAGMSRRGRAVWRAVLIPLVFFGYGVETIQILRGFDPRFSRVSSPADQALGGLFFLSAIGILLCFLVLMARFFLRKTSGVDGLLVLSLRYGAVAALAAFGVGIAMSALDGPRVPPAGNLLPLHAAGFHGMQAIPIVALLLAGSGMGDEGARRVVHLSGLAWLGACAAMGWQSFRGASLVSPSPATGLALLLLALWTSLAVRAALQGRLEARGRV